MLLGPGMAELAVETGFRADDRAGLGRAGDGRRDVVRGVALPFQQAEQVELAVRGGHIAVRGQGDLVPVHGLGQARGDHDHQLGLVGHVFLGTEQVAQDRDVADAGEPVDVVLHGVADQTGDDEGLAVAQLDHGIGPAGGDGRHLVALHGHGARVVQLRDLGVDLQVDVPGVHDRGREAQADAVGLVVDGHIAQRAGHGDGHFAAHQELGGLAGHAGQVGFGQHTHQAVGLERVDHAEDAGRAAAVLGGQIDLLGQLVDAVRGVVPGQVVDDGVDGEIGERGHQVDAQPLGHRAGHLGHADLQHDLLDAVHGQEIDHLFRGGGLGQGEYGTQVGGVGHVAGQGHGVPGGDDLDVAFLGHDLVDQPLEVSHVRGDHDVENFEHLVAGPQGQGGGPQLVAGQVDLLGRQDDQGDHGVGPQGDPADLGFGVDERGLADHQPDFLRGRGLGHGGRGRGLGREDQQGRQGRYDNEGGDALHDSSP